jgi:(E)-4-hydroxy-3-methylbut-2-enyl-diphosphate synthase
MSSLISAVTAAVGAVLLGPSAAAGMRAAVGTPAALRVSAAPLMADAAASVAWTPSCRGEPGQSPRDLAFGSLGDVPKYCEDLSVVTRRKTRTVTAGPVKFGSDHPLVRQTMATTLTSDVPASVDQIMRCADEGFDLVRLTVVGMKDAKSMVQIRAALDAKGYDIPLCADMHFAPKVPPPHPRTQALRLVPPLSPHTSLTPPPSTPPSQVAMVVADAAEKIRINPGNFIDGRKTFDEMVYDTDEQVGSCPSPEV